MSIEAVLKQRRSVRSFSPTPLTLEEIGQLCWAAQGVTDQEGHRTAPSARSLYPLSLYVATGNVTGASPGLYRYEPASHSLQLVAAGDKRDDLNRKAVGQDWIVTAPAIFVIAGNASTMTSGGDVAARERGKRFMWVEAGLAAQGFFLQATSLGLGSTYVGGFRSAAAHAMLRLPSPEEVLAILPVGRRP